MSPRGAPPGPGSGPIAIAGCAIAIALAAGGCAPPEAPEPGWEVLEPGLELGRFHLCDQPASEPPSLIVARASSERFALRLVAASAIEGGTPRPARDWALERGLAVATNAGMYREDYVRHVGLMIDGEHVNNPVEVRDFRSVLAFRPRTPSDPPFVLADLDETSVDELRERYDALVQNLRMIDASGRNVWEQNDRRTATAALGVDGRGRLLFLFNRSPRSVHDLVDCMLELPLDLRRAQYLEGGPEAALYVRAGGRTLEFLGSWSPASGETAGSDLAWPIPNVLGLERIPPPTSD